MKPRIISGMAATWTMPSWALITAASSSPASARRASWNKLSPSTRPRKFSAALLGFPCCLKNTSFQRKAPRFQIRYKGLSWTSIEIIIVLNTIISSSSLSPFTVIITLSSLITQKKRNRLTLSAMSLAQLIKASKNMQKRPRGSCVLACLCLALWRSRILFAVTGFNKLWRTSAVLPGLRIRLSKKFVMKLIKKCWI